MLAQFTDSAGRPVSEGWIIRQAFKNATVIDQAHRALGVWSVPEGTLEGSAVVTVEPHYKGRAKRDVITWMKPCRFQTFKLSVAGLKEVT